jgi:hypothetical protein
MKALPWELIVRLRHPCPLFPLVEKVERHYDVVAVAEIYASGRHSGGHCAGEERWTMNREITIGIGDERETAQEFIEAWRRTERREAPTAPEERLYCPDLETLLKYADPTAPGSSE